MSNYTVTSWDEYIGQEKLKERLQIHIQAALDRMEPLEDVLLIGVLGCGKSTLAALIASELETEFETFMMPVKPTILKRIVMDYECVVLFNEVHRLPPRQQEDLLPLIQDGYLQLDNGAKIEKGALTVVAATTEPEKIIK